LPPIISELQNHEGCRSHIARSCRVACLAVRFAVRSFRMDGTGKRFVYMLRSWSDHSRHYVGVTSEPNRRLRWHNESRSGHTIAHRPWSIVVSIEFPTERQARQFERYLKSGSGRAFAKRHFSA
jgi:predicted GIY-YIG superfamily endonuclease